MLLPFLAVLLPTAVITITSATPGGDGVCDAKECTVQEALVVLNDGSIDGREDLDLRFDIPGGPHELSLDLNINRVGAIHVIGKENVLLRGTSGSRLSSAREVTVEAMSFSGGACLTTTSSTRVQLSTVSLGDPRQSCSVGLAIAGTGTVELDSVAILTSGRAITTSGSFSTVTLTDVKIVQTAEGDVGVVGVDIFADDVIVTNLGMSGAWTGGVAAALHEGGAGALSSVRVNGFRLNNDGNSAGLSAIGLSVVANTVTLQDLLVTGHGTDAAVAVNDGRFFANPVNIELVDVGVHAPGEIKRAVAGVGAGVGTGTGVRVGGNGIVNVSGMFVDELNNGLVITAASAVAVRDSGFGSALVGGSLNSGLTIRTAGSVELSDVVFAGNGMGVDLDVGDLDLTRVDINGNGFGGTFTARNSATATDVVVINNIGGGVILRGQAIGMNLDIGLDSNGETIGNGGNGVALVGGGDVIVKDNQPAVVLEVAAIGAVSSGPAFSGRVFGSAGSGVVVQNAQLGSATVSGNGQGIVVVNGTVVGARSSGNEGAGLVLIDSQAIDCVVVDNGRGVLFEGDSGLTDVFVGVDNEGGFLPNGSGPAVDNNSGRRANVTISGGRYRGGAEARAIVVMSVGDLVVTDGAQLGGDEREGVAAIAVAVGVDTSIGTLLEPVVIEAAPRVLLAVGNQPTTVDLRGASICGVDIGVAVLPGSNVVVGDVGVRDGVACGVGVGVKVGGVSDPSLFTSVSIAGTIIAVDGAALVATDVQGVVELGFQDAELNGSPGLLVENLDEARLFGNVGGTGGVQLRDSSFSELDLRFDLAGVDGDGVNIDGCELPAFTNIDGVVDGAAARGVAIENTRIAQNNGAAVLSVSAQVRSANDVGVLIDLDSDGVDDELNVVAITADGGADGVIVRGTMAKTRLQGLASNNDGDGLVLDVPVSETEHVVDVSGFFAGARLASLFGNDVPRALTATGNAGHGVRCTGNTKVHLIGVSAGNNNGDGVHVEQQCRVLGLAGSQLGGVGNTRAGNSGAGLRVVGDGRVLIGDVDFDSAALGDGLNCFVQHNRGGGVIVSGRGALVVGPSLVVSDNDGREFDMGDDGRTANDVGDVDGVLNAPEITRVVVDLTDVEIHGIVGRGQTVHLYRSKSRSGEGEPFDHIASFVEGSVDDEDGSAAQILGFGVIVPATFVFRLPLSSAPAIAMASDGVRSSEASEVFFLDPCLPSALADDCDFDRDGIINGDERAAGTNIFLADSDADGLSDFEEGTLDSDGDGVLDALLSNRLDTDGDGLVDALDVDGNDACVPDNTAGACDKDGDGLSNADEDRYGTDKNDPDTDGDGIPDGFEAALDTDNDGLSNAIESNFGDVDNDGVPDQRDPVELAAECTAGGPAAVLRETVVLDTDADVVAFNASGVTCIVGNLLVGNSVTRLVLNALVVVTGRVVVRASDVETVELTVLVRAGTFEIQDNDVLVSGALPAINTIDGDLRVSGNARLSILDIRALRRVGGSVIITDNGALSSVSAPDLDSIGGDLDINGNDGLDSIDLPDLELVDGSVNISENPDLQEVSLPGLVSVGGDLTISDNPQLTGIDAGSLVSVGGDLEISGNDNVTDIDLNSLVSVGGDLEISDVSDGANIGLASLDSVGGNVLIDGTANLPPGWVCVGGVCTTACGDGVVRGDEVCDDGDLNDGDGCSAVCAVEPDFLCAQNVAGKSTCVSTSSLDQTPAAAAPGCGNMRGVMPMFAVLAVLLRRRRLEAPV